MKEIARSTTDSIDLIKIVAEHYETFRDVPTEKIQMRWPPSRVQCQVVSCERKADRISCPSRTASSQTPTTAVRRVYRSQTEANGVECRFPGLECGRKRGTFWSRSRSPSYKVSKFWASDIQRQAGRAGNTVSHFRVL